MPFKDSAANGKGVFSSHWKERGSTRMMISGSTLHTSNQELSMNVHCHITGTTTEESMDKPIVNCIGCWSPVWNHLTDIHVPVHADTGKPEHRV